VRILLVIPYFYPAESFGGSVKVAFNVGRELVKRGHEVVVYTSDANNRENRLNVKNAEVEGMEVYYFRNISMWFVKESNLFITPELSKKMKSDLKSFDVVHAHEYTTYQNIIVHRFARKHAVPYVLQVHGSLPKIGRKGRKWLFDVLFGRRLLRDTSKLIALSEVEAEQYRRVGVPEEKIAIIPNGIDLSEYANLPPKGSFKKKFNIPENNRIILYLGRIHKTKRIDLLVKAYAHLAKSMKYDDALLVIAGPDDGYLAEIKSLSAHLNVSDSVLFTGFISSSDKLKALVDADVFVTPSFYGFPVTFLEAGVTGTPIVTTSLGDTLDWIEGRAGYVTSPTCHELAKAMHAIISNDDLRQEFSRNSRRITQSEFSLAKVVDRLEQVYREVAGK